MSKKRNAVVRLRKKASAAIIDWLHCFDCSFPPVSTSTIFTVHAIKSQEIHANFSNTFSAKMTGKTAYDLFGEAQIVCFSHNHFSRKVPKAKLTVISFIV